MAHRIKTTLNSGWRFHKGDIDSTVNDLTTEEWQMVNLPHTWNDRDAFDEIPGYYQGVCWYVKVFPVSLEWKGKTAVLLFEGANQNAEVHLNGDLLGTHVGGYTAFGFELSEGLNYGEMNTIAVRLTNERDDHIPPLRADFTFYGGIYRNVSVMVTEPIHFDWGSYASDGVFIETPEVNEQDALVSVHGSIANQSGTGRQITIETTILDQSSHIVAQGTSKLSLSPNSKTDFSMDDLEISSPNLWSPERPYLYQVIAQIKEADQAAALLDEKVIPLGLRWFEFDDENRFWLNGKPLKLIGSNRHQDFEGLGNALLDDYHVNDFKQIKDLGFNFVRLAHYPQAPEVYRMCDELGLLVWSEIPVVSSITHSAQFFQNCLEMQREHIRQTRNHPSVVFYGYMNEIFISLQFRRLSDEERQREVKAILDLANQLEALTKAEAPDRYTVMAVHHNQSYNEHGLTDIPDVVGWNLYFGWYYQRFEDLSRFLAEQHARYPEQRMIVSEYGPGADVRIHSRTPSVQDFSQDFQFALHASYLKQMMSLPYLSGFAAWNFADFGSNHRGDTIPNINQKGLVNYNRTEKDVCGLYRACFKDEPVVCIASRNYAHRTGMEQAEDAGFCSDNVKVFSNQGQIELKLNGKSLGPKQVIDYEVNFDVPFTHGENLLMAVSENGHSDEMVINYTILPFYLDSAGAIDLAVNVGAEVSFYDPDTRVMWIPDRPYTPKAWGYVGGAPYTETRRQTRPGISQDIKGTDCNPLFQTFVAGIKSYRFDVPDGNYQVTLLFADHISRSQQTSLMYNLSARETLGSEAEVREFGVRVNGNIVIDKLNLEEDYGSFRAVTFQVSVHADKGTGIQVDFQPVSGKALLSGIRLSSQPSATF